MNKENYLEIHLWRLAGFNCFIVALCPTLHIRIAGIGLQYFLQLLLVFLAANVLVFHLQGSTIISLPISSLITWAMWRGIKYATRIQHSYNSAYFLLAALTVNTIIAILITIPFCISVFQDEIELANELHSLDDGMFLLRNFIRPLRGLVLAGEGTGQSTIIRFCCGSVFSLVYFCCFAPYLLTYQILKSTYTSVFNLYEQNFK